MPRFARFTPRASALLATTSIAALLLGAAPVEAGGLSFSNNPMVPVVNNPVNTTITSIVINGSAVTGAMTNMGTITPGLHERPHHREPAPVLGQFRERLRRRLCGGELRRGAPSRRRALRHELHLDLALRGLPGLRRCVIGELWRLDRASLRRGRLPHRACGREPRWARLLSRRASSLSRTLPRSSSIRTASPKAAASRGAHRLGRDFNIQTTTLGVRSEIALASMPLTLKTMLGWRHAYGDVVPSVLLGFQGGAQSFQRLRHPDRPRRLRGRGRHRLFADLDALGRCFLLRSVRHSAPWTTPLRAT